MSERIIGSYAAFVLRDGRSLFRAVRFLVRSGLQRRVMVEFLRFLNGTPLVDNPPLLRNVAEKVFREFCRDRFGVAERARLLTNHYSILNERLSSEAFRAYVTSVGLELARLEGRRGGRYALSLTTESFRKEGEAAVRLVDLALGAPLATVSFTLTRTEAGVIGVSIGGLQGPRAHIGKTAVVAATRDLSGLRPKALVVETVYFLAGWFGAMEIEAATKDTHVSRNNAKKQRVTFADLDSFWEELGGTRTASGDFRLPEKLFHRDLDDVPSKRKKEWLARRDILDRIAAETRAVLDAAARRV